MRFLPFVLFLLTCACPVLAQNKVADQAETIRNRHRVLLALGAEAGDSLQSSDYREELTTLGLQLWHEQLGLLEELQQEIENDPLQLQALLNILRDTIDWWDADKLAFYELLQEFDVPPLPSNLAFKLQRDREALDEIRDLYSKEIAAVFGNIAKRGIPVRRKMWDEYIAFIRKNYPVEDIMRAYPLRTGHDHDHNTTRGGANSIFGYKLPPKTLVLTFDDGPHYGHTQSILDILEERQIPAIFFQVGENVAQIDIGNTFVATSASERSKFISEDPMHWLGNHSNSHQLLSKVDSQDVAWEIDRCYQAIRFVTDDQTVLFRPPYGGLSREVRGALEKWETKPYLWNIDSRDWADPIPASIASRVVTQAREQGRGVILLHDIHKKTVDALPLMLDTLIADGFRFVLWDGQTIVDPSQDATASRGAGKDRTKSSASPYQNNWALVIGINEYNEWPKLQYAVNDAKGVEKVLVEKLNFRQDRVITLLNEDATREGIYGALEKLFDPDKVSENDAVFVFFAGHGTTRTLPGSRNKGYIIPMDAKMDDYAANAISMTEIQDFNDILPAKHVFWVMDACYSGMALTRGAVPTGATQRYIQEVTSRRGRQVLTAGGSDEEVADGGPNGHSIFTWTLINALSGDADLNSDNYITASELFNYIPPLVSSMSRQTPAYGSFVGSAGGDFVFTLEAEQELLSDQSDQHNEADMELKLEVERLRQELANMQQQINRSNEVAEPDEATLNNAEKVDRLNNQGLEFYRQQKYDDARKCFKSAVELDPQDVQSINNLGFIHYKQGSYDDAIRWIEKSLQLDPNRGVAYLNLADAQLAKDLKAEAADNYEMYIKLMPENDFTRQLSQKVEQLRKESGKAN